MDLYIKDIKQMEHQLTFEHVLLEINIWVKPIFRL